MSRPARRTVSESFEPSAESPRLARRFVRRVLDESDASAAGDSALLLVSELVTNAVLHARTDVEVIVAFDGDLLRVTVVDRSPVVPAQRSFSATAASGRGLHLVETLATRWGTDPAADGSGKAVWFELALDEEPATSAFDFDAVPSL